VFAVSIGPHPQANMPPGAEPVPSPGVLSFGYVQVALAARARRRALFVYSVSRSVYVPFGGWMSLITYCPSLSVIPNGSSAWCTPSLLKSAQIIQRGRPGSPGSRRPFPFSSLNFVPEAAQVRTASGRGAT
jgi:hypothetical protein